MTATATISGAKLSTYGWQTQALVSLWEIKRVDGTLEYYTNHDEDVTIAHPDDATATTPLGPVTFSAAGTSFDMTASRREAGIKSANVTVSGAIGGIDLDDVKGGKYDMALLTEWVVDARVPFLCFHTRGLYWITGKAFNSEQWEFELESYGRRIRELFATPFMRTCRWSLGRGGCATTGTYRNGIDIDTYTYGTTGTPLDVEFVDADNPRRMFQVERDSISPTMPLTRPYKHGRVTWLTGDNAGLAYDFSDYDDTTGDADTSGTFTTAIRMAAAVAIGDTCLIEEGCERTTDMCRSIYNNIDNYGGYDDIPGTTRARQAPRVGW